MIAPPFQFNILKTDVCHKTKTNHLWKTSNGFLFSPYSPTSTAFWQKISIHAVTSVYQELSLMNELGVVMVFRSH